MAGRAIFAKVQGTQLNWNLSSSVPVLPLLHRERPRTLLFLALVDSSRADYGYCAPGLLLVWNVLHIVRWAWYPSKVFDGYSHAPFTEC